MTDLGAPSALLVLRSTAWQWAFKVLTLLVGFATVAVVTRLMGAADFGRFGVVTAYVGFVVALSDLGLPTILVRDMARAPDRLAGQLSTALWGRALLVLPTYALAFALAVPLYHDDPVVLGGIGIALLALLPTAVAATLVCVLQVASRLHVAVGLELGVRLVTLAGSVLVLRAGAGVRGVVAVSVAVSVAHAALLLALLRGHVGRWSAWDAGEFRALVRAALPLGVAVVLNSLYFRIDTVILSLLRPSAEVGVYVAAYRVMEMMLVFPSLFAASALPLLSRAAAGERPLGDVLGMCLRVVVTVLLPLAVVVAIEARPLLLLVGGGEFAGGAPALRLLAFAAFSSGFNIVLGLTIIALDRQGRALWLNVGALALNVALNLALVPSRGIAAAAAATLACEALVVVGASAVIRRATGALPAVPRLGRLLVSAAVAAGVLAVLPDALGLVGRALVAAVVYAAGCLATRAVTPDEVRLLRATVRRPA